MRPEPCLIPLFNFFSLCDMGDLCDGHGVLWRCWFWCFLGFFLRWSVLFCATVPGWHESCNKEHNHGMVKCLLKTTCWTHFPGLLFSFKRKEWSDERLERFLFSCVSLNSIHWFFVHFLFMDFHMTLAAHIFIASWRVSTSWFRGDRLWLLHQTVRVWNGLAPTTSGCWCPHWHNLLAHLHTEVSAFWNRSQRLLTPKWTYANSKLHEQILMQTNSGLAVMCSSAWSTKWPKKTLKEKNPSVPCWTHIYFVLVIQDNQYTVKWILEQELQLSRRSSVSSVHAQWVMLVTFFTLETRPWLYPTATRTVFVLEVWRGTLLRQCVVGGIDSVATVTPSSVFCSGVVRRYWFGCCAVLAKERHQVTAATQGYRNRIVSFVALPRSNPCVGETRLWFEMIDFCLSYSSLSCGHGCSAALAQQMQAK